VCCTADNEVKVQQLLVRRKLESILTMLHGQGYYAAVLPEPCQIQTNSPSCVCEDGGRAIGFSSPFQMRPSTPP
jgi:hypothetical protein